MALRYRGKEVLVVEKMVQSSKHNQQARIAPKGENGIRKRKTEELKK